MGMGKRRNAANSRQRLNEYFLALAVKFRRKNSDASCISTGIGKGTHKPLADHVVGESQNWNAARGPLCRANCCISAARRDDIDTGVYQFGRMLLELLRR
jgi:hypothetical protein